VTPAVTPVALPAGAPCASRPVLHRSAA